MTNAQCWIGVDLDGTLAYYPTADGSIGKPVPAMVARVKQWLAEGRTVKIVTARVAIKATAAGAHAARQHQTAKIQEWCQLHLGQRLEVTCSKDLAMLQLWDDRCVQVIPNTGMPVLPASVPHRD